MPHPDVQRGVAALLASKVLDHRPRGQQRRQLVLREFPLRLQLRGSLAVRAGIAAPFGVEALEEFGGSSRTRV
ncbi:hypothetical protein FM112_14965 [Gulosibacter sp. 10]|nr:hypothetical protein FM112_14965 [Gulosibacter sp. 10]